MSLRVTLVHGWGYDATLWREVVPLLAGLDVELVDLGYFGAPQSPSACDAARLAVGHSLGTLWWLTAAGVPWTRLVAINGFPRFTAAPDFARGVGGRVLDRMRKRFETAPAAVLADFQAAAGGAGPAAVPDTAALAAGLARLADSDGRATLAQRRQDIWALAARQDAIVPPALTETAFAALPPGRLRWLADAGHLLPLTHARECAALIREAARP